MSSETEFSNEEFVENLLDSLVQHDADTGLKLVEKLLLEQSIEECVSGYLEQAFFRLEKASLSVIDFESCMRGLMQALLLVSRRVPLTHDKELARVLILPVGESASAVLAELNYIFLKAKGFDVEFLAPHTNVSDLAKYLSSKPPESFLLCCAGSVDFSTRLSSVLRVLPSGVPLLLSVSPSAERECEEFTRKQRGKTLVGSRGISEALSDLLYSKGGDFDSTLAALGARIRIRRKELRISQEELSQSTELSRAFVSSIENAKVNPSLEKLHRIANILKTPLHKLLEV